MNWQGSDNYAGTSRTFPSFQMIIGNPRWRSSMRFFFVARLWACAATRAHSDISLSGIGFRILVWGFMKQLKVRFGKMPKPARWKRALPGHYVFA